MLRILMILFLACLGSCSPTSMDDYQKESDAHSRTLLRILNTIQSPEDLIQVETKLRKKFNETVDLIIEIKNFLHKHQDQELGEVSYLSKYNDELCLEFKRIYQLENGREVIQRAQKEALIRLDAFNRSLEKKKQHRTSSSFHR